ncbi:sensor histidine kinase [Alteromonas facilis]|uniref:sensor histidine kinase n=1 Tax=Alteromonas facilis TaxID=2048004 RepID=UPI000C28D7F6|nr:ATP-binding protein [Alteromonas facilis]
MRISLRSKLILAVIVASTLACVPLFYFSTLTLGHALLLTFAVVLTSALIGYHLTRKLADGLDALETGLLNLKDGEYSTTLAYEGDDEFMHLSTLYNETADKLRQEKHWLYQRELLLDKITQSSPEALFLVNRQQQIVFSNIAARQFFGERHALEGRELDEITSSSSPELKTQFEHGREGLFTLSTPNQDSETWYLSTGRFNLNNQPHTLFILKQMTRELSRQEVAVWKKVIRIISHELNNSLGPISSMLHSGRILTQRNEDERLERVFATIEDRISHLSDFVQGYGKFAKLPPPKLHAIDWTALLDQLAEQWPFQRDIADNIDLQADPIQLEQMLINLLKNAHESGSDPNDVSISAQQRASHVIIEVHDRGKGMSEKVLGQALIPFYSTKASGSGLGLALSREITDAHQGTISLQNRSDGGIKVRIVLPSAP